MWIGSVMLSCPQIDINLHNRHQIKRLFLENFFAGRTSVDQLESWQTWRWWGASRTSPNIMAFNWYGTFQSGVFNLIAVVIQGNTPFFLKCSLKAFWVTSFPSIFDESEGTGLVQAAGSNHLRILAFLDLQNPEILVGTCPSCRLHWVQFFLLFICLTFFPFFPLKCWMYTNMSGWALRIDNDTWWENASVQLCKLCLGFWAGPEVSEIQTYKSYHILNLH